MRDEKNPGLLFAGLILGAAAGVAAGMLLSPKTGKENRDKLKTKMNDAKDIADRYAQELNGKINQVKENIHNKIKETNNAFETHDDLEENLGV